MNPTRLHLASAFACAAIGATCAFGNAGCGDDACELDAVTRNLGGAGLIDCGLATMDDPGVVDRCAVTAHGDGSTFRALYERGDGGVDVIMRIAGGDYVALQLVGDDGRIERANCDEGRIAVRGARRYVECVDRGEFSIVCR